MSLDTMERLTATLTLVAGFGAVCLLVGRFIPSPSVRSLVAPFREYALWVAFLVAAVAMAGSLYFSEVANMRPCRLCWFQRTAMYPLAIVLLVGALRRDRSVRWYAIPLAAIGAPISLYHYLIEWNVISEGSSCDPTNPCSALPFDRQYGFISLSFMALTGFVFVLSVLTLRGDSQ